MLLAYTISRENIVHDTAAAKRQAGTAELELRGDLSGQEVDIYIAFTSNDREQMSNSEYLGR